MRDQYAGDISDFLKFAFLRALAGTNRTLGVAWYYVHGHDGRSDGQHIEWRGETKWQSLDAQLYVALSELPERSVAALEGVSILPNDTLFHRVPMPSRSERGEWSKEKRAALDGADLIFLDPNNGLGDETVKHATFSELRLCGSRDEQSLSLRFLARTCLMTLLGNVFMKSWHRKQA